MKIVARVPMSGCDLEADKNCQSAVHQRLGLGEQLGD
jgi:hypothetical protein